MNKGESELRSSSIKRTGCGAEPLYFLDYMAFGKLDPNVAESIVEGFSIACRENNCALIAGETAEMPGLYKETEYDLS